MPNIEITVEGLNERQRVLADIIWACETRAQINKFVKSLPTRELQTEAEGVFQVIMMAAVEQAYDGISNNNEANSVINRIKNG